MKKREDGITLIALIITIIVMLILVMVTINVALNGGLFRNAKEAAFKHEVQEIREALTVKQGEELSKTNGDKSNVRITFDDLENLSQELKDKYKDKFKINKDLELCYIKSKFTDQEIEWLNELGVKEYNGLYSVIENKAIQNNHISDYGIYDYVEILKDTIEERPNALIFYTIGVKSDGFDHTIIPGLGTNVQASQISQINSSTDDSNTYRMWYEFENIMKAYNITVNDVIKVAANNQDIENQEAQTAIQNVMNGQSFTGEATGWDALGNLFVNMLYSFFNFVIIDGDEVVLIGYESIEDLTDTKQVMTQQEFTSLYDYGIINNKIMITGYKGTSRNIIIPSTVYNDAGQSLNVVGVLPGVFGTARPIPITELVDVTYMDDSATVADLAQGLVGYINSEYGVDLSQNNPFTGYPDGTSTSIQDKDKYVMIPYAKIIYYTDFQGNTITSADDIQAALNSVSDDLFYPSNFQGNYMTVLFIDSGEPPINIVEPFQYDSLTGYFIPEFESDDEDVYRTNYGEQLGIDEKQDVYKLNSDLLTCAKKVNLYIGDLDYTDINEQTPAGLASMFSFYEASITSSDVNPSNSTDRANFYNPYVADGVNW